MQNYPPSSFDYEIRGRERLINREKDLQGSRAGPLSGASISFWHLIVLAIALLLMPVVLLACNSFSNTSPNDNGCTPPPSVPTATPGQRFQVGQQINVDNKYVISLDSAKLTLSPGVGPELEVQLSTQDFPGYSSSVGPDFTLSSPTEQSYFLKSETDGGSDSCGSPAMYDLMFEVPLADLTGQHYVLTLPTSVASLGSLVWDVSANLSPTAGCPPPTLPSVPTAITRPGQRFQVGQQINVNNLYVISLDSAKKIRFSGANGESTPDELGSILEVQLSVLDFSGTGSSLQFTLSSPTGQSYGAGVGSSSTEGCGLPSHGMYDLTFEVPQTAHRFVLMLPTGVIGSLVWDISA